MFYIEWSKSMEMWIVSFSEDCPSEEGHGTWDEAQVEADTLNSEMWDERLITHLESDLGVAHG